MLAVMSCHPDVPSRALTQLHEVDRGAQDVRVQDKRTERAGPGADDPLPQQRRQVLHQAKELRGRKAPL